MSEVASVQVHKRGSRKTASGRILVPDSNQRVRPKPVIGVAPNRSAKRRFVAIGKPGIAIDAAELHPF
jgi:hypothetical protein